MSQTLCEANPGEVVAHRATCHLRERNGTWQQWRNAAYVVGGSGMLTSVDDLHQWERNFLKNQLPAGPHLEELLNNGALFGNRRVLDVNPKAEYRGIKRFEFTGGVFGSATAMLRFPGERLAIIVLANRDDIAPWTLAERVADILLADKLQPEIGKPVVRPDFNEPGFSLSKQQLPEWTGAFRLPNDGPIWQTAIENESLVLMDHLEENHALQPVSEKRFRVLNSDDFDDSSRFTFERTAPTEPWTITNSWWTNSGEKSQQLIPVRLAQPSESELAAFAGTYVSDELPVSYRIEARASVLWLQVGPRGWEQLEPTVENEFIPSVRTAHDQRRFRFQRDESNRVTGFSVSFWRIQDLRFHRQPSP